MFSGPVTPTPSELLGSEQFAELLRQARKMYDYVVEDTPPIGSVVDGLIVGRQCNGTVLTVASRQISYRFAQDIVKQLTNAKCHILGCVLNKVEMAPGSAYGKYYGKYYEYYGKYGEDTE